MQNYIKNMHENIAEQNLKNKCSKIENGIQTDLFSKFFNEVKEVGGSKISTGS